MGAAQHTHHPPARTTRPRPGDPALQNPCIPVFGPGPAGRICAECQNLRAYYSPSSTTHTAALINAVHPVTRYTCTRINPFDHPELDTSRRITAPACSLFELSDLTAQLEAAG